MVVWSVTHDVEAESVKPVSEVAPLHYQQLSLKARTLQSLPKGFYFASSFYFCFAKKIVSMQYVRDKGSKPIEKSAFSGGEKL